MGRHPELPPSAPHAGFQALEFGGTIWCHHWSQLLWRWWSQCQGHRGHLACLKMNVAVPTSCWGLWQCKADGIHRILAVKSRDFDDFGGFTRWFLIPFCTSESAIASMGDDWWKVWKICKIPCNSLDTHTHKQHNILSKLRLTSCWKWENTLRFWVTAWTCLLAWWHHRRSYCFSCVSHWGNRRPGLGHKHYIHWNWNAGFRFTSDTQWVNIDAINQNNHMITYIYIYILKPILVSHGPFFWNVSPFTVW